MTDRCLHVVCAAAPARARSPREEIGGTAALRPLPVHASSMPTCTCWKSRATRCSRRCAPVSCGARSTGRTRARASPAASAPLPPWLDPTPLHELLGPRDGQRRPSAFAASSRAASAAPQRILDQRRRRAGRGSRPRTSACRQARAPALPVEQAEHVARDGAQRRAGRDLALRILRASPRRSTRSAASRSHRRYIARCSAGSR